MNELTLDQLKVITGGGLASSPLRKNELNWSKLSDVNLSLGDGHEMAPVIERAVAVQAFL